MVILQSTVGRCFKVVIEGVIPFPGRLGSGDEISIETRRGRERGATTSH